jgi:hypothetical protein
MTDWLSVKQQVEEFHKHHGGEAYLTGDGSLIYIDGATRSREDAMWVPPAPDLRTERGRYEAASRKLQFLQAKLAHFVGKFDALKADYEFRKPTDEEFALQQLTELGAIVKAVQTEVRKAQAEVDATAIGQQRKAAQNSPQTEMIKRNDWHAKVDAIRV